MISWLFALALLFAPPAPLFAPESPEARRDRFESIAQDIAATDATRAEAAMLLALAIGESGLTRDTDIGPCYRKGALRTRCDSGTSATIWQIKPIKFEGEPLGVRELFADRRRAARVALWAVRSSLSRCRSLAPEDRLSGYGAGHCLSGNPSVRARYSLFLRLLAWVP